MANRKMAKPKAKVHAPSPRAVYKKHVGKPEPDNKPHAGSMGKKRRLIPKGFI